MLRTIRCWRSMRGIASRLCTVLPSLLTYSFRQRIAQMCITPAPLAPHRARPYDFHTMALIPIKTASETGYCDCICGCYELASLRDEDTGKGYCPACAK